MNTSFRLSERDIKVAIVKACDVLKSVSSEFVLPKICEIKLTKASSYWANIQRIDGGKYYRLRVSSLVELIPSKELAQRRLEECMIHEMIHTMPGRFNHGEKFKAMCNKVNKKYDGIYTIRTRNDCETYGIHREEKPKVKFEIKCEKCGKTYYYSRKPKYDISEYSCSKCGHKHLTIKNI